MLTWGRVCGIMGSIKKSLTEGSHMTKNTRPQVNGVSSAFQKDCALTFGHDTSSDSPAVYCLNCGRILRVVQDDFCGVCLLGLVADRVIPLDKGRVHYGS